MAKSKSKALFGSVAVLSALGMAISGYLTWHFYQLRVGVPAENALCDFSPKWSCGAVAVSKSAEIFGGMPVSLLAWMWFLALTLFALLAFNVHKRAGLLRFMALGCGVALLASVAYLYIMLTLLHGYCAFCLGIDVINVAIFALVVAAQPNLSGSWVEQWKTVAVVAVVSVLAGVGFSMATVRLVAPTEQQIAELLAPVLSSAQVAVVSPSSAPRLGTPQAPIQIVEFADFECPHCRLAHNTMTEVLERHPGQVELVFRNFPLDGACNKLLAAYPAKQVKFSCEAARAVVCAHQQGKFAPVYHAIFSNQLLLSSSKIEHLAKIEGVDMDAFKACMAAPQTAQAVLDDVDQGIALDLQGTPTFYINGHKSDALPLAAWDALIQKLLAK